MILNYISPKNYIMDFNTITAREIRNYAQLKGYLENIDNELVGVLQSKTVWNIPVKSRQLITEATRWARAAENDLIKLFVMHLTLNELKKDIRKDWGKK